MTMPASSPERIRRTIYLSVAGLLVGYQAVNAFVPNSEMILATRVLALGFYATVLYVYGPDAWRALFSRHPKRSDFLVIGIFVSFLSHFGQSFYSILYRLAPSTWLFNSEFLAVVVQLSIVAAMLHVTAPGAVDGTVPRRNRIALGIGVGLATLAVGGVLLSRPDVAPVLDRLRPYIGDFWRTGEVRSLQIPPHG